VKHRHGYLYYSVRSAANLCTLLSHNASARVSVMFVFKLSNCSIYAVLFVVPLAACPLKFKSTYKTIAPLQVQYTVAVISHTDQ
jgi:hypothetical protein